MSALDLLKFCYGFLYEPLLYGVWLMASTATYEALRNLGTTATTTTTTMYNSCTIMFVISFFFFNDSFLYLGSRPSNIVETLETVAAKFSTTADVAANASESSLNVVVKSSRAVETCSGEGRVERRGTSSVATEKWSSTLKIPSTLLLEHRE